MRMYTTPTFILKMVHLVIYVQLVLNESKRLYSASLLLVGWFL